MLSLFLQCLPTKNNRKRPNFDEKNNQIDGCQHHDAVAFSQKPSWIIENIENE